MELFEITRLAIRYKRTPNGRIIEIEPETGLAETTKTKSTAIQVYSYSNDDE